MRVVFAGTPPEAVPSLEVLDSTVDVELVVTRPDRPRGRSGALRPPAVKTAAAALGLAVTQPSTAGELEMDLEDRTFDVGVVVAFGMILRPSVLGIPTHGFINVHFSLLPRWRGAAPVERAIMAGDVATGVSIMAMDEGLDTGPVIATESTPIHPHDTAGSLRARLAGIGARLLGDTLPLWVAGEVAATPQESAHATYAARIEASDRNLDHRMSRSDFTNRVRALCPSPGARLRIGAEAHKILAVSILEQGPGPGRWVEVGGAPVLGLEDGAVEIEEIQPPGKRIMSGREWLRGRRLPT